MYQHENVFEILFFSKIEELKNVFYIQLSKNSNRMQAPWEVVFLKGATIIAIVLRGKS